MRCLLIVAQFVGTIGYYLRCLPFEISPFHRTVRNSSVPYTRINQQNICSCIKTNNRKNRVLSVLTNHLLQLACCCVCLPTFRFLISITHKKFTFSSTNKPLLSFSFISLSLPLCLFPKTNTHRRNK